MKKWNTDDTDATDMHGFLGAPFRTAEQNLCKSGLEEISRLEEFSLYVIRLISVLYSAKFKQALSGILSE